MKYSKNIHTPKRDRRSKKIYVHPVFTGQTLNALLDKNELNQIFTRFIAASAIYN